MCEPCQNTSAFRAGCFPPLLHAAAPRAELVTETTRDGVTLQLVRGDIAAQEDIEAVVNAANAQLVPGGGVAGALHRAAGHGLLEEARPLAPIRPGEAVLTGAHDLPNGYVIHALGPVYGRDRPSGELLARCYREALRRAEEQGVASVAFPALSTGSHGYPAEPAVRIALTAVREAMPGLGPVRTVRFVLHNEAARDLHARIADEVFGGTVASGAAPSRRA